MAGILSGFSSRKGGMGNENIFSVIRDRAIVAKVVFIFIVLIINNVDFMLC
jgi:hypothetical protein